jgi:lipopolysaccharide transport system permease protein
MWTHVRQLIACRELLVAWTIRDVRVRYKQTVLGVAWAVIQPLSLMLVFTLVFTGFVRLPPEQGLPYPLFAYVGLLAWTLTATSLSFAVTSLTRNTHVLTTTYFPRDILPLSAVAAGGVDFAVAVLVLAGLLVTYQVRLSGWLALAPAVLLVHLALTAGLALWTSALNVFWRDVHFVVPLALQLWLYASPIAYPSHLVPAQWLLAYRLNPMVGIVEGYRNVVLRGAPPDWGLLGVAAVVSVAVLLSGYAFFKRAEPEFADVI